ncbi:MAG: hypothetical protein H6R45_601 [Proteobacteria bacterium]|nr:hypothetical protein [Pseudomonadota bacterium]
MFRVSSPMRADKRIGQFRGFASGLALSLALATGGAIAVTAAAPAQAQSDAPQYSKAFAKAAQKASEDLNAARNRPEVATEITNLIAASKALGAARDAAAIAAANSQMQAIGARIQGMTTAEKQEILALLGEAKNGDEKYLTGDFMAFLGNFSADRDLRLQGLKLKLDSGVLKPEAIAPTWLDIAQIYYDSNRFDDAHKAYDTAYGAGNMDAAIYATDVLYKSNRAIEGLDYLEGVINARLVAGLSVPQTWYGNGLTQARNMGDPARVAHWAALYGSRGNSPESWNASIKLLMDSTKFGLQEQLDIYRLMKRTGALLSANDYVGYIEAADARSMANEVLPALNEAIGKGLLTSDAATAQGPAAQLVEFTQTALEVANRRAPEDRNTIGQIVADARASATGIDARDAGDVYQSFGAAAEAEEMFKLALAKGGVDNDRVLTRLGIVQADQGKFDEARASFVKVSGIRAPIATLWLAWLDTKSAPTV